MRFNFQKLCKKKRTRRWKHRCCRVALTGCVCCCALILGACRGAGDSVVLQDPEPVSPAQSMVSEAISGDLTSEIKPDEPETVNPADLQYLDTSSFSHPYGHSGISVSYDGSPFCYAYVENWDAYYELPVRTGEHAQFVGSLEGDVGAVVWANCKYGDPFRTVTVAKLTLGCEQAEIDTLDLGREVSAGRMLGGFTDVRHGSLFIFRGDTNWQMYLLRTDDGGQTWYEPAGNTVAAQHWRDVPILAKFVTQDIGILAYRYATGENLCDRTYLTRDGGRTWELIPALSIPNLSKWGTGTEAVDFRCVDGVWLLDVIAHTSEQQYHILFSSPDTDEWTCENWEALVD